MWIGVARRRERASKRLLCATASRKLALIYVKLVPQPDTSPHCETAADTRQCITRCACLLPHFSLDTRCIYPRRDDSG